MGLSADCAEKSRPRAEREQLRPQAKREPYGGFRDPDRYPSGMGEEPSGGPARTWFQDPALQRTGMGEESLSSLARTSTHRRHCGALAAMGQEGALAARSVRGKRRGAVNAVAW